MTTPKNSHTVEHAMPYSLQLFQQITIGEDKQSKLPGFTIQHFQHTSRNSFEIECTPIQYDKTEYIQSFLNIYSGKQIIIRCFENDQLVWRASLFVDSDAAYALGNGKWFNTNSKLQTEMAIRFEIEVIEPTY